MNTFTLPKYGGKQGVGIFRLPVNRDELIAHCNGNNHIWIKANAGDARQCKVNGAVRTWKRDLNRVEIPLKYGLYEYATFDLAQGLDRVLIEVRA